MLLRAERGALVLSAVDEAASVEGLTPGLPLADARAMVPHLAAAEREPGAEAASLERLAHWALRYTPWVALDRSGLESVGEAGLLLDVTGCAHLFGGEAAMLSDLIARLARSGYSARAAIADTPGAAWAMARFGSGQQAWSLVPPGETRAALAPLPVAALRLEAAAIELLERLGLTSVGALYAVAPAALSPRLGRSLNRRLAQALGEQPEALSPLVPVPPHLVRRCFGEPIGESSDLARAAAWLAAALCRKLESRAEGARRLRLMLHRVDGTQSCLELGLGRPSREAEHLTRLLVERLEQVDPGFGVEVMSLAALRAEPLAALQIALGKRDPSENGDLAALLDRLGNRIGLERLSRQVPQESYLPERAARRIAPLEQASGEAWRATVVRPLRLLERPEPIEALAVLPDHPPARFRWRRLQHRVVRAEGPERISAEWWRLPGEPTEAPLRDYFRVEDEAGRRFWLYRSENRWYLHGLFA